MITVGGDQNLIHNCLVLLVMGLTSAGGHKRAINIKDRRVC